MHGLYANLSLGPFEVSAYRWAPILFFSLLAGSATGAEKPNILFILADDLGYGDLGCYGQKTIRTPHLDQFATEGMRFTQCYAGSTVCAPSRCALMTGLHTGHCRVRGNARVPLHDEDVTVAEVLRDAGYVTGIIGKWGLGEPETPGIPNRQGFDEWFGYLNQAHAHNYYPEYLWKNETRFPLPGNFAKNGVATRKSVYSHALFTDAALEFLDRHHKDRFFLYLAFTLPHANNEAGHALGDGMEVPDYGEYADKPWPTPEKGRAAMITLLDRDIGRILARLDQLGLADNTIVFFSSDNGPHNEGGSAADFFDSNGPLRGTKRDLTEGGIRVPGIVRWPGHVEPGVTSDYPWAFWDFLPTAAALAGASTPKGLDGVSMLPALTKNVSSREVPLYWEFHERGFAQGVRQGNWKGIRQDKGPLELYDLASDPGETKNVATRHPEIARKLEDILDQARTDSDDFPVDSSPGKNKSRKRAAMRSGSLSDPQYAENSRIQIRGKQSPLSPRGARP
ncbi:MAG: arylsulfatase [Planctomycetota bacterium]